MADKSVVSRKTFHFFAVLPGKSSVFEKYLRQVLLVRRGGGVCAGRQSHKDAAGGLWVDWRQGPKQFLACDWMTAPMIAENTGDQLRFFHVGGVLRLNFYNLTNSENSVYVNVPYWQNNMRLEGDCSDIQIYYMTNRLVHMWD